MGTRIQIKRVYDTPDKLDGLRILVDRLWPRGLSKGKAAVDFWMAGVAPSTTLRKWFGHEPWKWEEFQRRYIQELRGNEKGVKELQDQLSGCKKATLLFAAKTLEYNHVIVLKEFLKL